jgi:hypothetical protein
MRRFSQNNISRNLYVLQSKYATRCFSSFFPDEIKSKMNDLSDKTKKEFENLQSESLNETKRKLNNLMDEMETGARTGDTITIGLTLGIFNISISRTHSQNEKNELQKKE